MQPLEHGYKEIDVELNEASAEQVRLVNARLVEALASEGLAIQFMAAEGRWVTGAKVRGDAHSLAAILEALRQVSKEHLALEFTCALAPDGETLVLRNGSFGADEARVLAFLKSVPTQRPTLGQLDRVVFSVARVGPAGQSALQAFTAALQRETAHRLPRVEFTVTTEQDTWVARAELDGSAVHLRVAVLVLQMAWGSVWAFDPEHAPNAQLRLEGSHPRTFSIQGLVDWAGVDLALRPAR